MKRTVEGVCDIAPMLVRKDGELSMPISVPSALDAEPGGTNWPNEPFVPTVYVREVARTIAVLMDSLVLASLPRTSRMTTAPRAGTRSDRWLTTTSSAVAPGFDSHTSVRHSVPLAPGA